MLCRDSIPSRTSTQREELSHFKLPVHRNHFSYSFMVFTQLHTHGFLTWALSLEKQRNINHTQLEVLSASLLEGTKVKNKQKKIMQAMNVPLAYTTKLPELPLHKSHYLVIHYFNRKKSPPKLLNHTKSTPPTYAVIFAITTTT